MPSGPSYRSTSYASSSRVMTDEGSLRATRTWGLVSVRLAVATVIALDGGLDDARAVGIDTGRQHEHGVRGWERMAPRGCLGGCEGARVRGSCQMTRDRLSHE